jgi:hypothetical protein
MLAVINEKAALLSAIDRLVDQLKADRSLIDTNAVALQLLSFYPESGMASEQIARQVERTAAIEGAKLASKRTAL